MNLRDLIELADECNLGEYHIKIQKEDGHLASVEAAKVMCRDEYYVMYKKLCLTEFNPRAKDKRDNLGASSIQDLYVGDCMRKMPFTLDLLKFFDNYQFLPICNSDGEELRSYDVMNVKLYYGNVDDYTVYPYIVLYTDAKSEGEKDGLDPRKYIEGRQYQNSLARRKKKLRLEKDALFLEHTKDCIRTYAVMVTAPESLHSKEHQANLDSLKYDLENAGIEYIVVRNPYSDDSTEYGLIAINISWRDADFFARSYEHSAYVYGDYVTDDDGEQSHRVSYFALNEETGYHYLANEITGGENIGEFVKKNSGGVYAYKFFLKCMERGYDKLRRIRDEEALSKYLEGSVKPTKAKELRIQIYKNRRNLDRARSKMFGSTRTDFVKDGELYRIGENVSITFGEGDKMMKGTICGISDDQLILVPFIKPRMSVWHCNFDAIRSIIRIK